ncbi:hypothetical protein [Sinorhizobium medicae]|nr:hypothetical protein [Sinorhizobium medicae]
MPNAFDRWGENNNQLELSIYWLTSTVSSRQTRSSVKEIVTRYRDHVTAKEGEAVFFVFAVRASRRNTLVAPSSRPSVACMDGLRVARGSLVFPADWSGAGMYTAFDCGAFMPLALM